MSLNLPNQSQGAVRKGFRPGNEVPPPKKPSEDVASRLLLVGGNDSDRRHLSAKFAPMSISLDWHWANRAASRRGFPKCDGVVVYTQACAHSLFYSVTRQAKEAGVPVIHHDTWSTTEQAVAALGLGRNLGAGMSEPEKKPRTNLKLPVPTDEVVVETLASWKALDPSAKSAIRQAAVDADRNLKRPVPPEATEVLWKFNGNPRGFIATVVLATKDQQVTQAAVQRLHSAVTRKKAESTMINQVAAKVAERCGDGHGLRKGEIFDIRKVRIPKEKVQEAVAPPTPQLAPVPTPVIPEVPVPPTTPVPPAVAPAEKARARFFALLQAALDAGRKVSAERVQDGFVMSYADEDEVSVRVEVSART